MKRFAACMLVSVLVVLGFAADAFAAPARLGAIGDSMSTAFDADDDCDTLIDCAMRIGEDRGYSWTTGYQLPDSFRNRLGYATTVEKQRNGARWRHGARQAQAIVDEGGAAHVTIQLGGNDVCRDLNDTLPTKAEIQQHIHSTLSTLVHAPAEKRPAEVIIGAAPDVVGLYNVMANSTNFLFESCQDVWDLDTTKIQVNICDWGFFDFLCDLADFVVETTADFVSPLSRALLDAYEVEMPCGYILSSHSNAQKRSLAAALQRDINAAIAEEVTALQGTNGVTIRLAANVGEYQFTQSEVSQLDCYHPSRTGQQNVARITWAGAGLGQASPSLDTAAPTYTGGAARWVGSGTFRDIHFDFDTNENSTMEVWTYVCDYDTWYYEGTTNETPTLHDFHIQGLNYNLYWRVFVRPTDVAKNVGTWYATGCF